MIVLIVGGTGTLAQELIPILLANPRIDRIRILSRGEHKQCEMREKFNGERIDYLLGDVRDYDRVCLASEYVDEIYHLAAHKGVDSAEYDPYECVLTNIVGTKNVIFAARKNQAQKVVFTSSDKACEPINLYGATKLTAEKMMVQANIGRHRTKYSCCRYGNVLASNGSVVQKWRNGWDSITDPEMTRFWITPKKAAEFVHQAMSQMEGSEVFIPKMKSCTIREMWWTVMGDKTPKVIRRPGEKQHECLISQHESEYVTDVGWAFIRWPEFNLFPCVRKGNPVIVVGGYTSLNSERFKKEELEELCRF